MRVDISSAAADLIAVAGGQLWVWAARPRMCCSGAPAWMRAAVSEPDGITGFAAVSAGELTLYVRPSAGQLPEVLEIAVEGRRRPRVAAFWDGCLMAMTG